MKKTISFFLLIIIFAQKVSLAQASKISVPTVAIMSENSDIIAAQHDGYIYVWEKDSNKLLAKIKNKTPFRGAISHNALIGVVENKIFVWRGPGFSKSISMKMLKTLSIGKTIISSDGSLAAAFYPSDGGVGDPNAVRIWDARTGQVLNTFVLKKERIQGITFSSNNKQFVVFGDVINEEALVYVYGRTGNRFKQIFSWANKEDKTTFCAAFSPNSQLLALCSGQRLLIFSLPKKQIIAETKADSIKQLFPKELYIKKIRVPGFHQVTFSYDGQKLATLHAYGVVGVALWNAFPLKPEKWIIRPREGGIMRQITFGPNNDLWLIASDYSPNVYVLKQIDNHFKTARVLECAGQVN